jgi:hypothetical protein
LSREEVAARFAKRGCGWAYELKGTGKRKKETPSFQIPPIFVD